ncbi:MAG: substrate-binding periplasmic protein [Leucobacter sp.]
MKTKTTLGYAAGAAALMLGLSALTACSSGTSQESAVADDCTPIMEGVETVKPGKLTAAVAEYPPYVSQAGGEVTGVDGVIMQRIADELCLELNLEVQGWPAIYENTRNGAVDMAEGNIYLNKERLELYEVSVPVYRDEMFIVSKDGISSLEDMKGKKVGTVQGYLWVEDFQNALGKDNVQLYASEDAAYQDVANGRIEAAIMTSGGARQILEANNDTTLKNVKFESNDKIAASVEPPQSIVLAPKGNTEFIEAVNLVIEGMQEDGSLVKALTDNGFEETAAETDPTARDRVK